MGQGKQIEIGKSNFSSKVNSTGVWGLYITELGTENCWEARIGVKARSVNKKSIVENCGVQVRNHEVEARCTERM